MSRAAAVDFAVRQQLADDGKNPPKNYKEILGPRPAGAPAALVSYDYTAVTLRSFLLNVANRLKLDTPPLTFAWKMLDIDACLTADVATFEAFIQDATT